MTLQSTFSNISLTMIFVQMVQGACRSEIPRPRHFRKDRLIELPHLEYRHHRKQTTNLLYHSHHAKLPKLCSHSNSCHDHEDEKGQHYLTWQGTLQTPHLRARTCFVNDLVLHFSVLLVRDHRQSSTNLNMLAWLSKSSKMALSS